MNVPDKIPDPMTELLSALLDDNVTEGQQQELADLLDGRPAATRDNSCDSTAESRGS